MIVAGRTNIFMKHQRFQQIDQTRLVVELDRSNGKCMTHAHWQGETYDDVDGKGDFRFEFHGQ